jgi:hypothetical protein
MWPALHSTSRRTASTTAGDQVGLTLNAELLTQGRPDVDLAEDSEALALQLLAHAGDASSNSNGVVSVSA